MTSVAAKNAFRNALCIVLFLKTMSTWVGNVWERVVSRNVAPSDQATLVILWTWLLGTLLYWVVAGCYAGSIGCTSQIVNFPALHDALYARLHSARLDKCGEKAGVTLQDTERKASIMGGL